MGPGTKFTPGVNFIPMPRGPRALTFSARPETLTRYGGVYLLHRFFSAIGLKRTLAHDLYIPHRATRYSLGELVLAVVYPIILGLKRLEMTRVLRTNGVFQVLTGLPYYPNATTLRRFLIRTAPRLVPQLRVMHDAIRGRVGTQLRRPRFVFDLDSTVLVVYGHQEGAEVGYNPAKPGRRSYHPLLCFEATWQEYWEGEFRPGRAHTATGTLDLLTACLAKIPTAEHHKPIFARADKGFYDHAIVEWLDDQRVRFVVVAKLTAPIKRKLTGRLRYTRHRGGISTAEFRYQPHGWAKLFRFVVIRRDQPDEDDPQLTLWKFKRYYYQVLVTNLIQRPLTVWRFYNQRARIEQLIRELKGEYALGSIPTQHYAANEAHVHLLLLAYNCVRWFQHLCLPPRFATTRLQRLREDVLNMPAYLTHSGRHPHLWIPHEDLAADWAHTLRKIDRLKG
jgi:hypothetical protein